LGSLGKHRNFPFCPKPWALRRIPDRRFPGYLRKPIRQFLRILFCLKIIGQIIYVEKNSLLLKNCELEKSQCFKRFGRNVFQDA
jgi:hypothetical protein